MSTSTLAWWAALIPAIVGVQLCLLVVRNRVRRALHRPSAPAPHSTERAVLERVIEEELHATFGDHFLQRHDGLPRDELRERASDLAAAAADHAATRLDLDPDDRDVLERELPAAVLAQLGLRAGVATYKP